jgi:hypothetical protein
MGSNGILECKFLSENAHRAWWKQVPTQGSVANAALQGHDWIGSVLAESKADAFSVNR